MSNYSVPRFPEYYPGSQNPRRDFGSCVCDLSEPWITIPWFTRTSRTTTMTWWVSETIVTQLRKILLEISGIRYFYRVPENVEILLKMFLRNILIIISYLSKHSIKIFCTYTYSKFTLSFNLRVKKVHPANLCWFLDINIIFSNPLYLAMYILAIHDFY